MLNTALYTHLTFPTLRLSYPYGGRLSNLAKVIQLVNYRITQTLNHSALKKEMLCPKGELQMP